VTGNDRGPDAGNVEGHDTEAQARRAGSTNQSGTADGNREHLKGPFLIDLHRRELEQESAIDPEVVAERGYLTVTRPTNTDQSNRRKLQQIKIPSWAIKEDRFFPGLLIPMYRATGELISYQFKPYVPVPDPKNPGKTRKYASRVGQANRIDVHPRNSDRVADPTVTLMITEGIKKADALTSRGACVIALTGVFNWRSQLATLGDWEDIPLKGRTVIICFDADARTNPNVLRAMVRLGRWLKSKNAKRVYYLIVPATVNGKAVKGADDYFAAGGTLEGLREAATTEEPNADTADDTFSDARMAETVAGDVLADRYCWADGLGWMRWDGRRWAECPEAAVVEEVRQYVLEQFGEVIAGKRTGTGQAGNTNAIDGWRTMLGKGRIGAVLSLARGIVLVDGADFDSDADLLNAANGVIDLRTGDLLPHDAARLITKLAPVDYIPGAAHPDWNAALEAVPKECREWYQVRLGQAITGHMTPDDRLILQQGGGENGKTTVMGAVEAVLGDYFLLVSHRALLASPDAHPTELMDFRGVRLALLEETPEERSLSVTRLKQLVGTPQITARKIRQDSVTFNATHSLFLSTNYLPVVKETDHGTWRRLALLKFPYTFRKPGAPLEGPDDREGDPGLRERLRGGSGDRREAVLAWLVAGAVKWYAADRVMPPLPERVEADTRGWRAESDLIVAYFDEQLTFDAGRHISTVDLFKDFTKWVTERGHHQWTDRTFAARFSGHDEVSRRVAKRKVRKGPARSTRHPGFGGDMGPETYAAWVGIRFRTPADDAAETVADQGERGNKQDHVPAVPATLVNSQASAYEGYPKNPEQPEQASSSKAASCPLCGLKTIGGGLHPHCARRISVNEVGAPTAAAILSLMADGVESPYLIGQEIKADPGSVARFFDHLAQRGLAEPTNAYEGMYQRYRLTGSAKGGAM
jgi:P4 family phage/plasmid primase-like protien